MTASPLNGSKCVQGARHEEAIKNLRNGVNILTEQVTRLEERMTSCEIDVAGIATRVTMWASLGVTIASVGIQILFKLLG